MFSKAWNLVFAPHRLDRIQSLLEIRLNHFLFSRSSARTYAKTFREFLDEVALTHPRLSVLMEGAGEAERAVGTIRANFVKLTSDRQLPFPPAFNADISLALLSYALTRYIKPRAVVETGVGYGITSSLILLAMEQNEVGRLVSIDLPPLSDPRGSFMGIAVPKELTHRWSVRVGSSRRWLREVLNEMGRVALFVSDSANVYTLQWYEFMATWPRMDSVGVAIFNNIRDPFWTALKTVAGARAYAIWQMEKSSSVTGLVLKER